MLFYGSAMRVLLFAAVYSNSNRLRKRRRGKTRLQFAQNRFCGPARASTDADPSNGPVKKYIHGICFFTGRLCGFCSGNSATTRKQKNCKSEICHRASQTSLNSNDINSLRTNKSEVQYAKEGMQRYAPMSGIILGVDLHSAPWSPS